MRLEHWIYTIPLRFRTVFRRRHIEGNWTTSFDFIWNGRSRKALRTERARPRPAGRRSLRWTGLRNAKKSAGICVIRTESTI